MKKQNIFLVLTLFSLFIMGCKHNSIPADEPEVPITDDNTIPAIKNPIGGICPSLIAWMTDAQLKKFLDEFETSGGLYVRIDLPWSVIQPDNNATWNFADYDRVINAVIARGFKLIVIPTYCPSWANGGHDDDKYAPIVAHTTDWGNFVSECAKRYVPLGVDAWEIWNEANGSWFWMPTARASDYVNIVLKPASTAIRDIAAQNNKTVTIITGGTGLCGNDNGCVDPLTFMTGIYANGGKEYFDAVGSHPYTFPESPYSASSWNGFNIAVQLYDIMKTNGDGAKKIWGTEMGFHTGNSDLGGVTYDQQAQFVTDAYKRWYSFSFAEGTPLCYYDYQDLGTDRTDREQCFGLKKYDGTNKPSWKAYKRAMASTLPSNTK